MAMVIMSKKPKKIQHLQPGVSYQERAKQEDDQNVGLYGACSSLNPNERDQLLTLSI